MINKNVVYFFGWLIGIICIGVCIGLNTNSLANAFLFIGGAILASVAVHWFFTEVA